MADLIVRLYDLEYTSKEAEIEKKCGVRFLRPLTCSKRKITEFIEKNFSSEWAAESETAFTHFPVTMFVAINEKNEPVGFAAYESTGKGFFGPTGVRTDYRKKDIGAELLLKSLDGLRELGYAYAVIGGTAEDVFPFYAKVCGAEVIKGSDRSIYKDLF